MFKQVIYYFMAVVEEGSFSKAAKKYYLSQSAISQQITKLEKDLGFSLFNRKTYCPTLTKEGKRYYDLAKRLIDDYNNEYEVLWVDMGHNGRSGVQCLSGSPFGIHRHGWRSDRCRGNGLQ